MGQSGNAVIGAGLAGLSSVATEGLNKQGSHSTPLSVFANAGYDSDPAGTATLGMTADLPSSMVAGVAVSGNLSKTDMVFSGNAKMKGGSLGTFIARIPDSGLQWLIGIDGITLSGDINRGYLNGSSLAF